LLRDYERQNRDLALARLMQMQLLPRSVPNVPGFEFFAHYDPVYEVGGDFYDFIPLPDDRLAVVVGDVAGNGVAAALLMARFSRETRQCMLAGASAPAAASLLNRLLFETGIDETFITLCLSILEITRPSLSLVSAGHPPVAIRRSDGSVEEVGAAIAGYPLGMFPGSDYQQTEVPLHAGDVVAMFSDGVTDARNQHHELYDCRASRRLIRTLAATHGGPRHVGRAIVRDICDFASDLGHTDDVTLVCFGPLTLC
jgi:serine phosphatase RsbU (regulator of sigma subunit)